MKRFIDTNLPDKEWYMDLSPSEKCAIIYVYLKCDNAGVWNVNKKLAEFHIGGKIDWDLLIKNCNGNITILTGKKWWLTDFCIFQYGNLDEKSKSKPIMSHIKLLKRHNLWDEYQRVSKGYPNCLDAPKEKDKEKDQAKDKEKVKDFRE